MSIRNLRGVFGLALLLGAGCGDSPVPVRGTVTLDGTPVAGALVLFLPEGGTGRQASGQTGSDGSFQLTTSSSNDGALRGKYKVVVQYSEGPEAPPGGNVKDVMLGLEKAQKAKRPPPKYVIPERYSNPEKTELRQEVPANGPVTLALVTK
jgi:hypothetical protein